MAKSQNIVHHYFKKSVDEGKILVKVNPIEFIGTELTVPVQGDPTVRDLEFDSEIFDDLKADGFEECSPLEYNLYLSGLA